MNQKDWDFLENKLAEILTAAGLTGTIRAARGSAMTLKPEWLLAGDQQGLSRKA